MYVCTEWVPSSRDTGVKNRACLCCFLVYALHIPIAAVCYCQYSAINSEKNYPTKKPSSLFGFLLTCPSFSLGSVLLLSDCLCRPKKRRKREWISPYKSLKNHRKLRKMSDECNQIFSSFTHIIVEKSKWIYRRLIADKGDEILQYNWSNNTYNPWKGGYIGQSINCTRVDRGHFERCGNCRAIWSAMEI